MLFHIVFRQFDSNGETLDDENDSRELQGYLICISPCSRINQSYRVWSKDDSAECGDCCFANVESFLDEGRTQHEQRSEATEYYVDQMRPIDGEVIPCHLEWGSCLSVSVSISSRVWGICQTVWSDLLSPESFSHTSSLPNAPVCRFGQEYCVISQHSKSGRAQSPLLSDSE